MHYEQYYQLATEQQFLDIGIELADLTTCRVIQQANQTYTNMRGLGNFEVTTGMLIRHLEFSNGYMQSMWASGDNSLVPFKIDELNLILANEPSEEV